MGNERDWYDLLFPILVPCESVVHISKYCDPKLCLKCVCSCKAPAHDGICSIWSPQRARHSLYGVPEVCVGICMMSLNGAGKFVGDTLWDNKATDLCAQYTAGEQWSHEWRTPVLCLPATVLLANYRLLQSQRAPYCNGLRSCCIKNAILPKAWHSGLQGVLFANHCLLPPQCQPCWDIWRPCWTKRLQPSALMYQVKAALLKVGTPYWRNDRQRASKPQWFILVSIDKTSLDRNSTKYTPSKYAHPPSINLPLVTEKQNITELHILLSAMHASSVWIR